MDLRPIEIRPGDYFNRSASSMNNGEYLDTVKMIAHYQQNAEDFYRETPFNGRVYHEGGEATHYLGSARVKRFRRIAEKTSRHLIDFIFKEVKTRADALASERAAHLGIPVSQRITPIGEQREELFQAEQRVGKAIHLGQFPDTLPIVPINDILGVKAVAEECDTERVISQIDQGRDTSIIEREYLFRFALSPMTGLDEAPIKLWARYMPDYIDQLYQHLAGGSTEADFVQACFQVGGCKGSDSHPSATRSNSE